MFKKVVETETYAKKKQMQVNYSKTNLLVSNPGGSRDLHPRFIFNSMELEVVQEIKLLGVIVRNDLSWGPNTETLGCLYKRGYKSIRTFSTIIAYDFCVCICAWISMKFES